MTMSFGASSTIPNFYLVHWSCVLCTGLGVLCFNRPDLVPLETEYSPNPIAAWVIPSDNYGKWIELDSKITNLSDSAIHHRSREKKRVRYERCTLAYKSVVQNSQSSTFSMKCGSHFDDWMKRLSTAHDRSFVVTVKDASEKHFSGVSGEAADGNTNLATLGIAEKRISISNNSNMVLWWPEEVMI